jgi:hypothetical protein
VTEKITINSDHYVGAVRYNGNWHFFHAPLSMWILDFASYDEEYEPKPGGWRENLLRVDEGNAQRYIDEMHKNELQASQISFTFKAGFPNRAQLTFVVDFDDRKFINGWHDNIAIEEYAPKGWMAEEDDPYEYVPENIKTLWER